MTVEDLACNLVQQGSTVSYYKVPPKKRSVRPYALLGIIILITISLVVGRL